MFPEGSLLDPKEAQLLSFKQDSMNPMNEGFIELWSVKSNICKQFKFRKRLSKIKANNLFDSLSSQGWRIVEEQQRAA